MEDFTHYDGASRYHRPLPQILTRNTILPSLSTLDAADVIEVYALFRDAKLDSIGSGSLLFNKNFNSNGNNYLKVRKSAIAFRYKPKPSSPESAVKSPFELTLEYGPQRTGATQSFEAMPNINGGHGRDLDDAAYVSWENHAKIYYTLSIQDQEWKNAYFMAPITGAVLSKILNDFIVEYPIRHPRYQPFTIVEKETRKTIVKSSDSDDFIWNVMKALADLFVDIQPVLAPKRYGLRVYVQSIDRDFENLGSEQYVNTVGNYDGDSGKGQIADTKRINVASAAAEFYSKMYSCIAAIGSGDYSAFDKTSQPTLQPTLSPTPNPTTFPTIHATHKPTAAPTPLSSMSNSNTNQTLELKSFDDDDINNDDDDHLTNGNTTDNSHKSLTNDKNGGNAHKKNKKKNIQTKDNSHGDNERRNTDTMNNSQTDEKKDDDYYYDGLNDDEDSENNSGNQSEDMEKIVQNAEDAAQEALQAAEAAEVAAKSVDENNGTSINNQAAVAAAQAASAAKKAATATSEAAALNAMEYIFSGDGEMMTAAISTCFQNPKYGIRYDDISIDSEGNERIITSTNAYVYIDGSHYFRLNLTSPFVTVSKINDPLPKTNILPEGKGDFVDISLALMIIFFFLFGMYVMLHHIGLINRDRRMKFEWFFHPTKFSGSHKRLDNYADDIESASMDEDDIRHDNANGNGTTGGHRSIELTRPISNHDLRLSNVDD